MEKSKGRAPIIVESMPDWGEPMCQSLLKALKERDPYTYGHCCRVARNSKLLAQAAGLSEQEQMVIEYSSLFHDIGKIAIPDSILLKPGKLTTREELIMMTHPVKSAEIIQPICSHGFFKTLLPGVLHHHERIDGGGYPDQISGSQIPLSARIILIADTFDAMTTNRPYRSGTAYELAYKELAKFSGRQFDKHLVQIFLKAHPTWGALEKEITEEYITATYTRAA